MTTPPPPERPASPGRPDRDTGRAPSGPPSRSAAATNPGAACTRSDPLDRLLHAREARFTGSLSPASMTLAYLDWALHLANAPGRQLELAQCAAEQWARLMSPAHWTAPARGDRRFCDPAWSQAPFNVISQAFLLAEEWWQAATRGPPGVARQHGDVVAFGTRQIVDMFSPSNFVATNPEVVTAAVRESGWNFARGLMNYLTDATRLMTGQSGGTSGFVIGRDVAVTPGKVVLRNELIELIQYAPTTGAVRPQPILMVPAWIMKYYILDLSPHNSLVRFLVSQGFTVFCISWRNPTADMRDIGLDDYRRLGVMAALAAITGICGAHTTVHACGYCLGGTLLAITAAAMARDGDERLETVTLLAAQTDFTEAGELQLFTDESQLALLDDVMWRQGYLDSSQMAGAFEMLRSNDLVWSRVIKTYLLGEREQPTDLMAWNADATRMPCRMHSQYLHDMFLHNDLAEGRFRVEGHPVAISAIRQPIFTVGTETDHVAPWRSVYKIHLLNEGDITFVLTSGGHNAGIVSEPGHPHRHYRIGHRAAQGEFVAPEDWMAAATGHDGSWWAEWTAWLNAHSGDATAPPPLAAGGCPALTEAPGSYVRET